MSNSYALRCPRGRVGPVTLRRARAALFALFLASLVLALAGPASAKRASIARAGTAARANELERSVVAGINELRGSRGLRPLAVSWRLARAAEGHAASMARGGFFSHRSANGASLSQRIARLYPAAGFARWTVGENLLWNLPDVTPEQVVQSWLESPPHRQALLDPDWREIGLAALQAARAPGAFRGQDVVIVVADFGARG